MLKSTFKFFKNTNGFLSLSNKLKIPLMSMASSNSIYQNTIYSQIRKFVSSNPQSKVNRENREADKVDRFWAKVDEEEEKKIELEKKVESKYKEEVILIGRHIKEGEALDPKIENTLIDVYYVPLTVNDKALLDNFSKETAEKIYKGGRLVLYHEIKNYNKGQPIEKHLQITPQFEPLNVDEIKEIKKEFYEIYENKKLFNLVLQQGKNLFTELKEIKAEKVDLYLDYLSKLSYIDHYGEVTKSIPFNTKISVDFQKYKDPAYVEFYLTNKKLDQVKLEEKLKDIYFDFYNKIENSLKNKKNEEGKNLPNQSNQSAQSGLEEIKDKIEPCLYDRINTFVDYLYNNKIDFEFKKESSLPEDKEQFYIFEKLFFKGVSLNRYNNSEPDEYILIDTHEDLGIRYYLHKYLMGESHKVHQKNPLTSYAEYNSNDFHNSLSFQVKERNRKIVLRVYMFLKHPYIVKMNKDSGQNLLDYSPQYTHNHLAVFENELEAPHHTYLINNNFERWLLKQKLNPEGWRLVDVDNFMKGNPFFLKKSSYEEKFEEILNDEQLTAEILSEKFPEIENPEQFTLSLTFADDKKKTDRNDSKKKRGKKANQTSQEPKSSDDNINKINSLEFDYRITKIRGPVEEDFTNLDKEEIDKIRQEELKIAKEAYVENVQASEEIDRKQEELLSAMEGGLNSQEKLDQLLKIYYQGKFEKTSGENINDKLTVEIKYLNEFIEGNKKEINYKSELERLVNNLLAKKLERLVENKGEFN